MTAVIATSPKFQFSGADGLPLINGTLTTYLAGTTTPTTTWQDRAQATANTNPIVLDGNGECLLWLAPDVTYKFVLADSEGVQQWSVDNISGAEPSGVLSAALAASGGSALIGFIQAGAGAVATTAQTKMRERISVADYGAVGDFDPTTGTGTDDRVAIQAALTYATSLSNCEVIFPGGSYYLGTGYNVSTSGLSAQVLLGSLGTANAVSNVILRSEGAAIYQGAPGTALAIANAANISIENLKMVGYAGGTLDSSREFDNLIGIFLNSKFISIDGCYITNSLGYTVYTVGDPNTANGGTADTCLNITIRNSTLKTRYGNGAIPNAGGSKSLWAFASVDAQNVVIQNNVIYGNIDFEPNNLADQSTYGIFVDSNQFPAGYVTPVLPVGASTYWADEPIGKSNGGGTAIQGSVSISGATGAPVNGVNVVSNNSFDQGTINIGTAVYYQWVLNNSFRLGKINVGSTSGGNVNRYYRISGNTSYDVLDATSGFIVVGGSLTYTVMQGNSLVNSALPVISWDGVGGADGGFNSILTNTSQACSSSAISFPSYAATSVWANNTSAAGDVSAFTTALTDGTNAATLSASSLLYKLEGKLCTFNLRLFVDTPGTLGAAGSAYITLPFTSSAACYASIQMSVVQNLTPTAGTQQLFGYISPGVATCTLFQASTSGVLTSLAAANFASNTVLIFSGSYFIA